VTLTDRTGTVAPAQLPAFTLGKLQTQVTVAALSAADAITATDALGHSGTSNDFPVQTGLPAQLEFTTAPATLEVGACSQQVQLQVHDVFGQQTTPAAQVDVALSAEPSQGFGLFSDPACTTAAPPATLAPGAGSLSFYFKAQRAGPTVLHAVSSPFPTASQIETVTAAKPTKLVFASPAQDLMLGACSDAVSVGLHDAFDNGATSTQAMVITLDVSQAVGLSTFSDAACSTPATTVMLAGGAAEALFYLSFQGAGPTTGLVTASAPASSGIASAEQTEGVTR
jgi:hypothetical protein